MNNGQKVKQQQETPTSNHAELGIVEYLKENPDFLHRYPELLDTINLTLGGNGAVSLTSIQMQRQRQRIQQLEEEISSLMSLASANDRTFHEFMELQEQILNCECACDVVTAIRCKASELGLSAFIGIVGHFQLPLNGEAWARFKRNHLNGKLAYLGRLKHGDRIELFSEERVSSYPELGSYVILPLGHTALDGCLIFSSKDGGHFQPDQDTLFLRHLALVCSHLIAILPWQSHHEQHSTSN